jgi:hypothetical protein
VCVCVGGGLCPKVLKYTNYLAALPYLHMQLHRHDMLVAIRPTAVKYDGVPRSPHPTSPWRPFDGISERFHLH